MSGQTVFAAALLNPALPAPHGLHGRDDAPAGRRFDVYRNNVVSGLIDALEAGFPVVQALVGPDFFRAMAGDFVRDHPPRSPRLMLYGAGFGDFLAGFPPAQTLPYLPDVARLEYLLRESYHAADSGPVDAAALAAVPPQRLAELHLRFAPSMRLMRSDWPVAAIWAAHRGGPPPRGGAEDILIARPGFDPVPHVMPAGGVALVAALRDGVPLGAALAQAPADFDETRLQAVLGLLLSQGAICTVQLEETR